MFGYGTLVFNRPDFAFSAWRALVRVGVRHGCLARTWGASSVVVAARRVHRVLVVVQVLGATVGAHALPFHDGLDVVDRTQAEYVVVVRVTDPTFVHAPRVGLGEVLEPLDYVSINALVEIFVLLVIDRVLQLAEFRIQLLFFQDLLSQLVLERRVLLYAGRAALSAVLFCHGLPVCVAVCI